MNQLLDFIDKERDINYEPIIDENKPLNEQNILKESRAMIAMLELDYWCETDEEIAELLRVLQTNEQELKELLENITSTRELMELLKKYGT